MRRAATPPRVALPLSPDVRRLPVLTDLLDRVVDDDVLVADVERGTFTPHVVPTTVSGISRDMIVLVGRRDLDGRPRLTVNR